MSETLAMPFADLIGVEILEAGADQVRARLAWRADLCTAAGILHGGALMAFADSIGEDRSRLVSVGRYALRGVGRPQDLYTLEAELERAEPARA